MLEVLFLPAFPCALPHFLVHNRHQLLNTLISKNWQQECVLYHLCPCALPRNFKKSVDPATTYKKAICYHFSLFRPGSLFYWKRGLRNNIFRVIHLIHSGFFAATALASSLLLLLYNLSCLPSSSNYRLWPKWPLFGVVVHAHVVHIWCCLQSYFKADKLS